MRPLAVAFAPHPDDESYAMAGTLAELARRGWRTRVACLTRGEAGASHLGPCTPAELARRREAELAASCAALGAEPVVLGLPDGGLAGVTHDLSPHAEGARLVLTLGDDGAYGHPDHLATTRMVRAMRGPWTLWLAVFPRGLFAPVHRALSRHVRLEREVETLGVERSAASVVIDVRAHREAKLASIAAHRSQRRTDDVRSFLAPGFVDGLLDEEWWAHAGGPALELGP
ncbi:MAG: PIG-L family deacetylase [Sandaracinaceae bacterium]|nr:PIG-L family deacetylase [Sandaracinaceae bacterium]